MNPNETSPAPWGGDAGSGIATQHVQSTSSRPPRKWQRVLKAFVDGRSLNRFEAERELHDHCLHTTVAMLQGRGLIIHRHDERVPGYAGIPTIVCRYHLALDSYDRARELLARRDGREA